MRVVGFLEGTPSPDEHDDARDQVGDGVCRVRDQGDAPEGESGRTLDENLHRVAEDVRPRGSNEPASPVRGVVDHVTD